MKNNYMQPNADAIMGMVKASGLKEIAIFTLLAIAVFRFLAQVPLFGIDNAVFSQLAAGNNLIAFIDLFSGGALGKVSIIALGIGPYITASIVMQLMAVIVPKWEQMQKEEGEAGRRKLSQYSRLLTVFIAMFQGGVFLSYLTHQAPMAILPGISKGLFFFGSMLILTAGAVFVMWLSELITERGIGNGGSLLIFAGILAGIPVYTSKTSQLIANDAGMQMNLVLLLGIFAATMVLIVIMQEAIRKVLIVNPKRQVGNKVYGGMNTHIPFKLNPGGVMPIIFAVAILYFPATVLQFLGQAFKGKSVETVFEHLTQVLSPTGFSYYAIYFGLIVLLTFFYASIMPNMQPKDIANNLKKHGSSIPGIKPGRPTAEALDKILTRTTFIGAMALGLIALIPSLASKVTNITTFQGIGATSLIIMVGVALDLINQVRTHLLAKQYESFLKE